MRLLGFVFIMMACGGLGLAKSHSVGQRFALLKEWQRVLLLIQQEITFHMTLAEAFESVGSRVQEPYDVFLASLSRRIRSCEGIEFQLVFSEEVDRTLKLASLSKDDLERIKLCGEMMQDADRAMQIQVLERYQKELEMTIGELQQHLPQQQKLYRSLGILGGVFLGILLL